MEKEKQNIQDINWDYSTLDEYVSYIENLQCNCCGKLFKGELKLKEHKGLLLVFQKFIPNITCSRIPILLQTINNEHGRLFETIDSELLNLILLKDKAQRDIRDMGYSFDLVEKSHKLKQRYNNLKDFRLYLIQSKKLKLIGVKKKIKELKKENNILRGENHNLYLKFNDLKANFLTKLKKLLN